jgi:N,N'-diacetyllegionaminate synthase
MNKIWINSEKPLVIAEIAMTHEGSLGLAMNMALAAKNAGASCVKFQTHFADEESSLSDEWRVNFSVQDNTRYDYWKRTEFNELEWKLLFEYCKKIEIECISSPFSLKACKLLKSLNMSAWKLGSGELQNEQMLEWILDQNEPLILSLGLSDYTHIKNIVERVRNRSKNRKIILLHCISEYPTRAEDAGLNELNNLKAIFNEICEIGLSDHSGMLSPAILSVARGVRVIEVHFTLSKLMFGPDIIASHDIHNLEKLVQEVNFSYKAVHSKKTKADFLVQATRNLRIFSRSLCYAHDLSKGHILIQEDFKYMKPGGGISYSEIEKLIGHPLRLGVKKRTLVKLSDIL